MDAHEVLTDMKVFVQKLYAMLCGDYGGGDGGGSSNKNNTPNVFAVGFCFKIMPSSFLSVDVSARPGVSYLTYHEGYEN